MCKKPPTYNYLATFDVLRRNNPELFRALLAIAIAENQQHERTSRTKDLGLEANLDTENGGTNLLRGRKRNEH
jgi:hypothetical protein